MSEMPEKTYHIYGRKAYTQPLEFVGTALAGELSQLNREQYDWLELIAFPETAVIRVIPSGGSENP